MKVFAHPLSTSRSILRLDGGLARLEIRVPLAEMDHVSAVNRDLPTLYRIGGDPPASRNCAIEQEEFVCRATFLAPEPLVVESHLPEAVLPHHIHTLMFEGRSFIFTIAVTQHNLRAEQHTGWWLAAAVVLAGLIVIGSLRLRRRILRRG